MLRISKSIFITSLLIFPLYANKDQYVFFELLGPGGPYSINYEKTAFTIGSSHNINYRLGLMFLYIPLKWDLFISNTEKVHYFFNFPLGVTYCHGSKSHKLETDLICDPVLSVGEYGSFTINGILFPYIGYRYQPKIKRISIRAGIIIIPDIELPVFPAASFGLRF